jgi:hypothetical protein
LTRSVVYFTTSGARRPRDIKTSCRSVGAYCTNMNFYTLDDAVQTRLFPWYISPNSYLKTRKSFDRIKNPKSKEELGKIFKGFQGFSTFVGASVASGAIV